jgi:hypothetical protein
MFAVEWVAFLLLNRQFVASKLGPKTGGPGSFPSLSNQHLGHDRSQEESLLE